VPIALKDEVMLEGMFTVVYVFLLELIEIKKSVSNDTWIVDLWQQI